MRPKSAFGRPRRQTWRGLAVSLAFASLFLAFATFISYIAPVHVLILEREGTRGVRAEATQQLWLVIPFRTRALGGVQSVTRSTHQQPAYPAPESNAGFVRPEGEGSIILRGERGSLEISTSPRDIDETQQRLNAFLSGSDPRLRVRLVSNWKVAVIVEAVILAAAVLILLAVAWDIGQMTLLTFASRG